MSPALHASRTVPLYVHSQSRTPVRWWLFYLLQTCCRRKKSPSLPGLELLHSFRSMQGVTNEAAVKADADRVYGDK